jgi:hypothetical protein
MKLCDPDHPLPPSRDVGLFAMAVPAGTMQALRQEKPTAWKDPRRFIQAAQSGFRSRAASLTGFPSRSRPLYAQFNFCKMSDIDYEKRASRCDNQDITVCALGSFR